MGVPKRKPSHSRQRMRRAYNSNLTLPQLSTCPQCAAPYVPHRVCPGVRLLQRAPGHHGQSDGLKRFRSVEDWFFRALLFMRMVVDVMGGDHGPGVVIDGARLALQSHPSIKELFLVGREEEIQAGMTRAGLRDPRVKIVHAGEALTMDDKPVEGLRRKKDCSILRAVDLLKEGKADALISPGNTGGIVAASTIRLRPLEGLDRPGIATVIPAPQE